MRPAGVLIPIMSSAACGRFRADRGAIMKVGMTAEVTCVSSLHDHPDGGHRCSGLIAAGQFRGGEQLIDPQQVTRPHARNLSEPSTKEASTHHAGSSCIANAYPATMTRLPQAARSEALRCTPSIPRARACDYLRLQLWCFLPTSYSADTDRICNAFGRVLV